MRKFIKIKMKQKSLFLNTLKVFTTETEDTPL